MLMVDKDYNLQRHHNDKASCKSTAFTCIYNQSCATTARSCAAQTARPFVFAKKIQPLTDSETVKDRMLAVVDEVINEENK